MTNFNGIDEQIDKLEEELRKPQKGWKCIDKGVCLFVPGLDGEWFKEVWISDYDPNNELGTLYLSAFTFFFKTHDMKMIEEVEKHEHKYPCHLEICLKDGLVIVTFYYTLKKDCFEEIHDSYMDFKKMRG